MSDHCEMLNIEGLQNCYYAKMQKLGFKVSERGTLKMNQTNKTKLILILVLMIYLNDYQMMN